MMGYRRGRGLDIGMDWMLTPRLTSLLPPFCVSVSGDS
jgi:hypothetical protein